MTSEDFALAYRFENDRTVVVVIGREVWPERIAVTGELVASPSQYMTHSGGELSLHVDNGNATYDIDEYDAALDIFHFKLRDGAITKTYPLSPEESS